MKSIFYSVVCWCLVCGFAGEALAYDGNLLLEQCQAFLDTPILATPNLAYENGLAAGACIGYMTSVRDNNLRLNEVLKVAKSDLGYCLPSPLEGEQLIRVIVKYLEDNPAKLHTIAAPLVKAAFREAFPCPEGE